MANRGHCPLPMQSLGVHGWCNALIIQNTWCQNFIHTNRHFGLSTPQWQLLLATVVSWKKALELNPTIKLLKTAPVSRLQFPQHNRRFSEDITSATLNGASVSSALHSQGWSPSPLSFLPICKFMPTLCFHAAHLPKITLLPLPVTQGVGTEPSSHSRHGVPLWSVLCTYRHLKVPFQCVANYFSYLSIFQKIVK